VYVFYGVLFLLRNDMPARYIRRVSVRLSVPPIDSSSGVRRVCCLAPHVHKISIEGRRRRSAANAGSVMLTADDRG